MRNYAIAAGAASLLLATVFSATAYADTTPPTPAPVKVTLQFHGMAAGKTKAGAEMAATASAAANEKQFTDQSKATCMDSGTKVTSQMIATDEYLASAVITSDCTIPVPTPPAS